MPKLILNGADTKVVAVTIKDMVLELGLPESKLAIELNKIIVPKSLYANTAITDNDQIEIVHFVGGG